MVRTLHFAITGVLLLIAVAAAAQGKFAGGKGGGAGFTNLSFGIDQGSNEPFPNPAPAGSLIQVAKDSLEVVSIYAVDGKLIKKITNSKYVAIYASGMYILKYTKSCKKLIIY